MFNHKTVQTNTLKYNKKMNETNNLKINITI